MVDFFLITVPLVVVGAVMIFCLLPRYGPHYTSKLTCPKCSKQFNYHWVLGGSFNSIRLGNKRYLRCPYCHKAATYNIMSTRVRKQPKTTAEPEQKRAQ